MVNVMRKRWDYRGNPASIVSFPVALAQAVEIGDLLFWDPAASGSGGGAPGGTGPSARPFSSTVGWTGSLAGSQGKVAELFIGVAMSAHVANDAAVTTVRVAQRGTFAYPLDSATTFEVGDLVGGVRDASNNFLLAQTVGRLAPLATASQMLAIGKVQKRYTTNTAVVEFEVAGRFTPGGGARAFLAS